MKIRQILQRKGHEVVTAAPDESVLDAVRRLMEHGIGAVVVTEGAELRGILSERDVLRLTSEGADLSSLPVRDAMTAEVITVGPGESLDRVMGLMTDHRIRHLPIVDGERLAGIVSIGDVVNACRKEAEWENRHLRNYIHGAEA